MLQLTPQMKILVAIEPIDGRKGIDSLAQACREKLSEDPFSGAVFLFRSRSKSSILALFYDGNGFWIAKKRLSKGTFQWWPDFRTSGIDVQAHQALTLLAGGNPWAQSAPVWRQLRQRKFPTPDGFKAR
jgi:transposase